MSLRQDLQSEGVVFPTIVQGADCDGYEAGEVHGTPCGANLLGVDLRTDVPWLDGRAYRLSSRPAIRHLKRP
jgi:hypothetical protein